MLELLLADGRTPTGGFAHSAGLEPAALAAGEVPAFVRGRLRTVGFVDAAIAAAAAEGCDPAGLDDDWAARTPSPPLREAGRRLGRGLLRVGRRIWPGELDAYAERSALTPRPVVLGLCGRAAGIEPRAVARLSLYEDAATVVSAAVKLMPIDPADATVWLAGCALEIDLLADAASAAARDGDLPAVSTPLLDRRALDHDHTTRRLFAT